MRITKSSINATPVTSNMWSSLVTKQNKKAAPTPTKFRVMAIKSHNSPVNRLEQVLNLDIAPFTDKIIAGYIWY